MSDAAIEWVAVRGVLINKVIIDQYEQEIGGKLISDDEGALLLALDDLIFQYFRAKGVTPPNKTVEVNTDLFIYRDIIISLMGIGAVEASGPKKMWFRRRKIY